MFFSLADITSTYWLQFCGFYVTIILLAFLLFITIKNHQKMSVANEQINAKIDQLTGKLTNIAADVTRIKEGIDPNGLTAEEAQAVIAKLDSAISQATAIDDATPEPVAEEPVEEPAPTEES